MQMICKLELWTKGSEIRLLILSHYLRYLQ